MGRAPLSDASACGDFQLSVFAARADASSGLSRRSHISSGERGGQAHDPDGVVEWPVAYRCLPTSLSRSGVLGWELGSGLRVNNCVRRVLWRVRVPALVHASAEAATFGTVWNFLSAQWASSASSPLHEP